MSKKGNSFAINADLSKNVKTYKANGKELAYMPWAAALHLAGRPSVKLVEFSGPGGVKLPYREIFGGAAVAVEINGQRVYLPVQNASFAAMTAGDVDARTLSDAQARCRAKAIAMETGVGLSVYADFKGDGPAFAAAVGIITTDTDLSTVPPMVSGKKRGKAEDAETTDFLGWPAAIAAAKLGDPSFSWQVEEWDVLDKDTGEITRQPYTRYGTGWAVGVTVTFRGESHTEILPIMGVAEVETQYGKKKMLDNQPLLTPNVNDWNKAVMRCLPKAIAVTTGYGLSIYAKMEFEAEDGGEPPSATTTGSVTPMPQKAESAKVETATASGAVQSREDALKEIEQLLVSTGADRYGMLAWIQVKSLEEASDTALVKVVQVLRGKAERGEKAAAAA